MTHKRMPGVIWMYLQVKCGKKVYHTESSWWWKDGREMVGTCGTTYKDAEKKVLETNGLKIKEKEWYYG